jgi:membrane protein required for colicin V production
MAAAITGLILAIWTYGVAGSFLEQWVSHKSVANFIGFFLVFFGTLVLGALVGMLLAKFLKWTGLGWMDRLLGGVFGLVRGGFVVMGIVLMLCAFTKDPPPKSVVNSRLAPYFLEAANLLTAVAPRELKDGFEASYKKVKETWDEMLHKSGNRLPTLEM